MERRIVIRVLDRQSPMGYKKRNSPAVYQGKIGLGYEVRSLLRKAASCNASVPIKRGRTPSFILGSYSCRDQSCMT